MAVDSRCECELDKVFDSVNSSLLVVSYQNIWSCDILCIRLKSDVLVRSQKNKSVWLNIKNPGNAVVLFPPIWGRTRSHQKEDLMHLCRNARIYVTCVSIGQTYVNVTTRKINKIKRNYLPSCVLNNWRHVTVYRVNIGSANGLAPIKNRPIKQHPVKFKIISLQQGVIFTLCAPHHIRLGRLAVSWRFI